MGECVCKRENLSERRTSIASSLLTTFDLRRLGNSRAMATLTTGQVPTTLSLAFDKVRTQTNSGVQAVRRPAVLLKAIDATLSATTSTTTTEISPAAYLVALLSTLEQLVTTSKPATAASATAQVKQDQRELLEATLYLLSLLTPHLPLQLLRTKSSTTLPLLLPLFTSFHSTSAPSLKSLLTISLSFLSSLSLTTLEKDYPTRSLYAQVLSLANDPRPKVRRRAQEVVHSLLVAPPPPAGKHPYGPETAQWILERLTEAVKGAKRGGKAEISAGGKGGGGSDKVKEAAKAVTGGVEGSEAQGSDESRAIALLTFIKNLGASWDDQVRLVSLFSLLARARVG